MTTRQEISTESDQLKQAIQDIAFGSLAGGAGKIIEYPFDTVKVRLQSQASGPALRYTGPIDCFRQSIAADGFFKGLYRGVSAPTVGAAIETSSLFFSYRFAQDALQAMLYDGHESLSLSALCIAGGASGAFTSLVLTPIELVKCRVQVCSETAGVSRPSVFGVIASTFRETGLKGFWRGQLGTLIRETGGTAAWFGSYEGASAFFRLRRGQKIGYTTEDEANAQLPVYQQLLAGAAAGMSYNLAFYPADTIKSRMQTAEVIRSEQHGTFWNMGKVLWREQGLKGLYRGCGITVARAAPSSAVIFTIYESLKSRFA